MRGQLSIPVLILALGLLTAAAPAAENHPPVIDAVPAQALTEDQAAVVLTLTGIGPGDPAESAQALSLTATADQPGLVAASLTYVGGGTAVLVLTPQPDQFGATVVRVGVRDDGGGTDTTELAIPVTISAVEDPPTCVVPAEWTIDEDESGFSNLRLWLPVSGLSGGPANEGGGRVYASANSTDTTRLNVNGIVDQPDGTAVSFHLEPLPNATGDVEVIILLQDRASTQVFRHVTVHIAPVNDAPRIVCGPMTIARGGSHTLTGDDLTVADADGPPAADLQVILAAAPTHGALTRDGIALAAEAVFTLQDVLDGRIGYTNDGSSDEPEVFAVAASDGIAAATAPVQVGIQILGHVRPFVSAPDVAGWISESLLTEVAPAGRVLAGDSSSFAGGFLRATVLNPDADDVLTIYDQGSGSGQIGNVGGSVSSAGVAFGSVSGGRGAEPLLVSFADQALDVSVVQALLRSLWFSNPSLDPSPDDRRIEIMVSDGATGTSVPVVVTMTMMPQIDDWPAVPAGTRLATLPGLSRTVLLGAVDPDRIPSLTTWSVSAQPGNATITILDSVVAGGPLVRLDPLLPGPSVVTLEQSLGGTSQPITLPVEVGSLDEARPHPCAEPPREAAAGDTVVIEVPWDTRDLGAGAALTYATAGAVPAGLDLDGMAGNRVRLSIPIPADGVPGTRLRFLILAEDRTRGFPGFLPVDITIRPLPMGGG